MTTNFQSLLAQMRAVDKTQLTNDERQQLRRATGELQVKLETPWETIARIAWAEPSIVGSMRTLVDLDLFSRWAAAGGGRKTAKELGLVTSSDPDLLGETYWTHACGTYEY